MGETAPVYLQMEWCIILLFTVVMTGFLAYIIVNSKHSRVLFYYCLGHTLTILLVITNFSLKIAPDIKIKVGIISIICFIKLIYDIMFLLYIVAFYKPFKRIATLVAVSVYMTTGIILILTNPLHHFIFSISSNEIHFEALYYLMMGIGFILEMIGMLCIMLFWVRKLDNQQFRIAASLIALLGILLFHFFLLNVFHLKVDFLPLFVMMVFALYFIGASRYGMFDAISLNSTYGLELFTDALIITNVKGKIIYRNRSSELLDGQIFRDVYDKFRFEAEYQNTVNKEIKTKYELVKEDSTGYYSVTIKPVKHRPFSAQKRIYIIHDNTKNIAAINLLSEKNQYLQEMNDSIKTMSEDAKKLAVLKERNLLANEIHDVVGHALILALNTMESNKLLEDKSVAMRRIRQVVTEIGVIINEIEAMRHHDVPELREAEKRKSIHLSEKLEALESRLSDAGVALEITAMDNLDDCQKSITSSIYRICQESITNAIKHGKAGKIAISVKKKSGLIELFIIDNGKGCSNIMKGTGLTSMEHRVQKLGGTISFSSFEGQEGFMVRAGIPSY